MNEIVVAQPVAPAKPDLLSQNTPADMLAQATQVANVLKDVLVKQNLISDIQGKKFVKVEGWNTMGCMLGILSREKNVEELEDGSFLAEVELYSIKTGNVVGTGSAICGKDEKRWGNADRYARRSMAITRATGKAFRLNFSWVMSLAGYEPTPEEEHPAAPSNTPIVYQGTPKQQQYIKDVLKKKDLPADLFTAVHSNMKGKTFDELRSAVEAAQVAAAKEIVEGVFES